MSTLRELGEFGLIRHIARIVPTLPNVLDGIGDDCAVVRVFDRLLLLSTDLQVEDVHFRRRYLTPEDLGWKAAAASLSDIAAMGGTPLCNLVSLACPGDTEVAYLESLYKGMSSMLARFGAVIVGGDTTRSLDRITIDMVAVGLASEKRYLRRKGAQTGDLLAVTGLLGLAAAGVHALERDEPIAPEIVQRYYRPAPRIREGQWLCAHPAIHAMLDISDGIIQDAGHLAEAAGLGVNIDPEALPIQPQLAQYCETHALDVTEMVLCGGEDYELAFAMSSSAHQHTIEAFHHEFRTVVTIIGEFTDQWSGVRVAGKETKLHGFDHFI